MSVGRTGTYLKYYRRAWDESRGDDYDHWGTSVWFFEIGADHCVLWQIEVYESGVVMKYDQAHFEDAYGGLAEGPIDEADFQAYAIAESEFETAWRELSRTKP